MKTTPTSGCPVDIGPVNPLNHRVEDLQPAVEAVLQRVLGVTDPEYEDILQDALVRVITTLDRNGFRGECPLASWAGLIARKVAADALRDRYRQRRVFVQDDSEAISSTHQSPEAGLERHIEARERLKRFLGALSRLSQGSALVVYLHSVLGYELTEIASKVGISVAAAQSRLVRGRREIARMHPGLRLEFVGAVLERPRIETRASGKRVRNDWLQRPRPRGAAA